MSEWGNPQGAIPVPHAKGCVGRTRGTETSKYPQEEKITMIPQVVASERGRAQTGTGWKVGPKRVKAPYAKPLYR